MWFHYAKLVLSEEANRPGDEADRLIDLWEQGKRLGIPGASEKDVMNKLNIPSDDLPLVVPEPEDKHKVWMRDAVGDLADVVPQDLMKPILSSDREDLVSQIQNTSSPFFVSQAEIKCDPGLWNNLVNCLLYCFPPSDGHTLKHTWEFQLRESLEAATSISRENHDTEEDRQWDRGWAGKQAARVRMLRAALSILSQLRSVEYSDEDEAWDKHHEGFMRMHEIMKNLPFDKVSPLTDGDKCQMVYAFMGGAPAQAEFLRAMREKENETRRWLQYLGDPVTLQDCRKQLSMDTVGMKFVRNRIESIIEISEKLFGSDHVV